MDGCMSKRRDDGEKEEDEGETTKEIDKGLREMPRVTTRDEVNGSQPILGSFQFNAIRTRSSIIGFGPDVVDQWPG